MRKSGAEFSGGIGRLADAEFLIAARTEKANQNEEGNQLFHNVCLGLS
jgi:hypothetical protein